MSRPFLATPWPWLAGALLVILLYLSTIVEIKRVGDSRPEGGVAEVEALREQEPNVLFILIDTLRSDRLEPYGYEKPTSPNLQYIADTGVLFRHHLSQSSWTKCSMASLWTGELPQRSGVTRLGDVIPEAARMPAEILAEAGYTTAALYRNGWVDPSFGFGQGFEVYDRPVPERMTADLKRANPTVGDRGTDWDVAEAAIEFVRFNRDKKWFLYIHMMDVHEYTYEENDARFGTDYSSIYDASVLHTDRVVGHLLKYLMDNGDFENMVTVIGSDHGEAFNERGHEGHARYVYPETQEVPWFLSLPFLIDGGVTVEHRSQNVDIWPTILDLLGLDSMGQKDGKSRRPEILAAMKGEASGGRGEEYAIAHLDQTWGRDGHDPLPAVSVAKGPHRYVLSSEPVKLEELFDVTNDRFEVEDLFAEETEIATELQQQAQEYLDSEPIWGEADELELDELQLNQLRALGYAIP